MGEPPSSSLGPRAYPGSFFEVSTWGGQQQPRFTQLAPCTASIPVGILGGPLLMILEPACIRLWAGHCPRPKGAGPLPAVQMLTDCWGRYQRRTVPVERDHWNQWKREVS